MAITVPEGQLVDLRESFLDDFGSPLLPHDTAMGPVVTLFDTDRAILAQVQANISPIPGEWYVSLPVPVLNIRNRVELEVLWKFKDSESNIHKVTRTVFVEPVSDHRVGDIVVLINNQPKYDLVLPFSYDSASGDLVSFSLYVNNEALVDSLSITDSSVSIITTLDSTTVKLPKVINDTRLQPQMLIAERTNSATGLSQLYTYNLWAVTPQVLVAAKHLEDWINKARIENIIPELDYTQADLIQYLFRGLNMFNAYQPVLTDFNGMNMQGALLDAWIVCGSYYALGAQLQAEGALAFDFSGQTVSLNIDRTPSIEAALSRVENQLENHVKPLKKLLGKNGVTGGDGSVGAGIASGGANFGRLGVINAPTTKWGYVNGQGINVTGRNFRRYY